ncbi:hypothetical protein HG430_002645 [Candidatus Gracilibacteria bacterium]|nr:hypothetical protein [Candidatus Gracilibacteria bacterium]
MKNNSNSGNIDNGPKVTYDGVDINISKDKLDSQREEISLDDIDLLLNGGDVKNPLLEAGKKFKENLEKTKKSDLTKRIDGGIEFKDFENELKKFPEELKREFTLALDIIDSKTGEKIPKGNVYMNGIKFGEFENGKFEKDFHWPKGIEKFDIIVRTTDYGDAFITLSSLNLEGSYLLGEVKLKKLDVNEKVNIGEEESKVKDKGFTVNIPDCSLVDSEGKCYKGEVTAKMNFMNGSDVNDVENNNLSLNMKALTKEGKIVYLTSGGMAFTDFVTNNGEILSVKKNGKIEITYNVTDDEIRVMETNLYGAGAKNTYWLYDKNKNLWLEKEAEIKLDKENKTWTAIVSEIY